MESPESASLFDLDSFQDQGQLHLADHALVGIGMEASGLQPLVPDGVAGRVPPQRLDLVSASVEEHEHLAAGRVLAQEFPAKAGQAIERLPHVRGFVAHEDPQI